jgi:hypothetical protein
VHCASCNMHHTFLRMRDAQDWGNGISIAHAPTAAHYVTRVMAVRYLHEQKLMRSLPWRRRQAHRDAAKRAGHVCNDDANSELSSPLALQYFTDLAVCMLSGAMALRSDGMPPRGRRNRASPCATETLGLIRRSRGTLLSDMVGCSCWARHGRRLK